MAKLGSRLLLALMLSLISLSLAATPGNICVDSCVDTSSAGCATCCRDLISLFDWNCGSPTTAAACCTTWTPECWDIPFADNVFSPCDGYTNPATPHIPLTPHAPTTSSNTPSITPSISESSTNSATPSITRSNTPSPSVTKSTSPSSSSSKSTSPSTSSSKSTSASPTTSPSSTKSVTPSSSTSTSTSTSPSSSKSTSTSPSSSKSTSPSSSPSSSTSSSSSVSKSTSPSSSPSSSTSSSTSSSKSVSPSSTTSPSTTKSTTPSSSVTKSITVSPSASISSPLCVFDVPVTVTYDTASALAGSSIVSAVQAALNALGLSGVSLLSVSVSAATVHTPSVHAPMPGGGMAMATSHVDAPMQVSIHNPVAPMGAAGGTIHGGLVVPSPPPVVNPVPQATMGMHKIDFPQRRKLADKAVFTTTLTVSVEALCASGVDSTLQSAADAVAADVSAALNVTVTNVAVGNPTVYECTSTLANLVTVVCAPANPSATFCATVSAGLACGSAGSGKMLDDTLPQNLKACAGDLSTPTGMQDYFTAFC